MNVPSWLKAILFLHITAVVASSCAAQVKNVNKTNPLTHVGALAVAAAKQEPVVTHPLQAGEYVTAKGLGHLVLSPRAEKPMSFNIQSLTGENVCDLSGETSNGAGVAVDFRGETSCVVNFIESGGGIAISTNTPKECKHFCGWNGGFEGVYLKVSDEFRSKEIESARREFKQLYDQKQYETALSKLSPVLENCSSILDLQEEGSVRNDVAITQHKIGLDSSCLKTLEPYAGDARKDDDEIVASWMPLTVGDRYLAIIKAARTNIRLCSDNAARATAEMRPDPNDAQNYDISHFIPTGAEVHLERRGDIDGDGDQDMLIVLQRTDASQQRFEPRTLLILQRNAGGALEEVVENSKAIPCQVCGGKYGDPIQEIKIIKNGLSLAFWGGIREAWSKEFRFTFSEHSHGWLLSEVEGGATDALNGNYCKDHLGPKNFGQVPLKEFDYAEFIEEFTTCTTQ